MRRALPFKPSSTELRQICNFRDIPGVFATSGQPDEQQFRLIKQAGYGAIINLAPTAIIENSLRNESEVTAELGLRYTHIPVDFKNPTDDNFRRFVEAVDDSRETKLWVHCAANMRVSAFTFRYRKTHLGHDTAAAAADLHAIWQPTGVWKEFIER
ncbi:MAG: protein tyrosine phosphatase family protein [Pseudomonadota bacterium]|nr:protein tyrosine phosphatase family protein [Pseudomonadota bacterium]